MKIIIVDNNYSHSISSPESPAWRFIADSACTNAGKPFFIPDFAEEFAAVPMLAVKINRLGKSIQPKFAARYYAELVPAIHFFAPRLMDSLRQSSLPADMAYSFDRSLFLADKTIGAASGMIPVALLKNGVEVAEFIPEFMTHSADEIIAGVSAANTLKMGDIIVPAVTEHAPVAIGDLLELRVAGKTVLSVSIK